MTPVVKAGIWSLVVNLVLVGIKSVAAWLSGSISVASDALHSASDAVVSVLVIINCAWSEGRKGRTAIYVNDGLVVLVALAIGFAGVEILYRAFTATVHITHAPTVLAAVLVTIIGAELLARYKIKVGRQYNASALTADGYHSRADAWSSIGVFIAVAGQAVGIPLDRPVGILIALLLFVITAELIASVVVSLKRHAMPDPEAVDKYVADKTGKSVRFLRDFLVRNRKKAIGVTLLAAAGLWVGLSSRVVRPGQSGFCLVFGRPVERDHGPGLMVGLEPFVKVHVVDKTLVRRVEIGFRTMLPLVSNSAPRLWGSKHHVPGYRRIPRESMNLAGDGNIVDYALVVHYTVKAPDLFMSGISAPDTMVREATRALLARMLGSQDIGSGLVAKRAVDVAAVTRELQALLDQWMPVFHVQAVYIHDLHPPVNVVPSFRDVFSAQEDVQVDINQAKAYQNDAMPKARGRAYAMVVHAQAKAVEKLASTRGRAEAFMAQASEFMHNNIAVRFNRYMDVLAKALQGGHFVVAGRGVPRIRYMDRGRR